MLAVRTAKSRIEHQEGMNHLWIQLPPIGDVKNARLQIILPSGVFRKRNLSNFYENNAGEIVIYETNVADSLFIEIYTQEAIMTGNKIILFALLFEDIKGAFNRIEHSFSIEVVDEEIFDETSIDKEVVKKIKDLRPYSYGKMSDYLSEYYRSKIIRIDSNQYSDLEKKYRIDS